MKYYLSIISYEPDAAVRVLGPIEGERKADRVEAGVNINLNHDQYYSVIESDDEISAARKAMAGR